MDGTIQVTTATMEPTTKAMDGTIQVTTATTEATTEAMDSPMQVTTAAMETTGETTGIFDISKIISIKIKELRTNSDSISCKPVNGVEMFILKQLEAIQKNVDSIMNCKYKNTTSENTLFCGVRESRPRNGRK